MVNKLNLNPGLDWLLNNQNLNVIMYMVICIHKYIYKIVFFKKKLLFISYNDGRQGFEPWFFV